MNGPDDQSRALSEQAQTVRAAAPPSGIPFPLTRFTAPLLRAVLRRRNRRDISNALQDNDVGVESASIAGVSVTELSPLAGSGAVAKQADDYLVYIHGGAFVVGEPVDPISIGLTALTGMQCLSLHYGLAPETKFPASIQEITRAWDAVTSGRSGRPVLVATSAGGNLALGLLQRLLGREPASVAVFPSVVVLFSPAADLHEFSGDRLVNEGVDPIIKWNGMLDKALVAYLGNSDRDDVEISPVGGDFRGLSAPTLLLTAEHDLLRPDVVRMADLLSRHEVPVELRDEPGLWHAFQQLPSPEAASSLTRVATFIAEHLAG